MVTIGLMADGRVLADAVGRIAKHGAARGSVMPVLSAVKLTQAGDELTLEATDLRHAARLRVRVSGADSAGGAVCVSAADLAALAAKLADGVTMSLQYSSGSEGGSALSGDRLVLRCGSDRAQLPVIRAVDFPAISWETDANGALTLDGGDLRRLITAGAAAMLTDDTRPAMGGAHLVDKGAALCIESADGYRATRAETEAVHGLGGGLLGESGLTIHRESVAVLRAYLQDGQQVRLSRAVGEGSRLIAEAADGSWAVALALVNGAFPDLGRIFDTSHPSQHAPVEFTAGPGSFRRALGIVGAAGGIGMVSLTVSSQDGVSLATAPSPENAEARSQLHALLATGFSGEAAVRVSGRLLGGIVDAWAAAGADDLTATISGESATKPVALQAEAEALSMEALVMPMSPAS